MSDVKLRTKKEWLDQVAETLPKCKWFIEKHFTDSVYRLLETLLVKENSIEIYTVLESIWHVLPDDEFNIKKMPEGWKEFLALVEFYSEDEMKSIFEK